METQLAASDVLEMLPEVIKIEGDGETRNVFINGKKLSPTPSQNLRNHSPDGFSWGYSGSGPAQLALAILNHFLPSYVALKFYQDFKFKVVSSWPLQKDFEQVLLMREVMKDIIEKRL